MMKRGTGHEMKNIGWNHFVCENCGLDDMNLTGIDCPGVRGKVACGWQTQLDTNGHCTKLFNNRAEALEHWKNDHAGLTGKGACEHFGLPNWDERQTTR